MESSRNRAALIVLGAVLLLVALVTGTRPVHAATQLCGATQTTAVNGGEYIAQNNVWGATTPQCISVDGTSFTVDSSGHANATNGAPASYPSLFKGCHWGQCTSGSGLPAQVGAMPAVTSDWSTTQPGSGAYDVAYDLWYDTKPSTTTDPDGAEVMIWLNSRGGVQPAGSRVAGGVSLGGATWDVWYSRMSWNYIAYVRTSGTTAVSGLDLRAFTRDAVTRGYIQNSWYLIDAEAGFEIWQGGAGLATNAFSVTVGGGGGGTPPPTGDQACAASLHVDNAWADGFTATVTVTNRGSRPLTGWSTDWTFSGDQTVRNAWNAAVTQNGRSVHAVNASHNGAVGPSGSTTFGFQGAGAAPDATPTCTPA
jgi:cellulase/cellobiase CelA1